MSKPLKELADELDELLRKERLKNKRKRRNLDHLDYITDNSGTGYHKNKKKYSRKKKHKGDDS